AARCRAAAFPPTHRSVRLSPRLPPPPCRASTGADRACRKSRAAPRSPRRPHTPRRGHRRADDWDRYAGGLSRLCREGSACQRSKVGAITLIGFSYHGFRFLKFAEALLLVSAPGFVTILAKGS